MGGQPQHQDPLVWNALASKWQNASNAGPSGAPLGIALGTPGGSQVSMLPQVGATVTLSNGAVGTIQSATQIASGAASENSPGYTCSLVFHSGLANEQIAMLSFPGNSIGGAQAILVTATAADNSVPGTTYTGAIAGSGSSYTYTISANLTPAVLSFLASISQCVKVPLTGGGTVVDVQVRAWINAFVPAMEAAGLMA
jgi:hypothetical protein